MIHVYLVQKIKFVPKKKKKRHQKENASPDVLTGEFCQTLRM